LTALFRAAKLRSVLETLQPDILHARSRVPAWLTYLANKQLDIPFVTTVHGFNSVSPYSEVMTRGDRVICVSGAIKAYIQEHYGTSDEKITIIPRGIDLEKFNLAHLDVVWRDGFIREYGLENAFVVSTVGRVTQLKDIETFIEAIAMLRQTMPHVKGLVVGGVREDKQAYAQRLHTLAEERGVAEHLIFTGSQSRVAEIYALSDVVVSSSKKPESFGRSVAEAIAVNTPVVATGHGGVLDIIQEGVNGYFYPVGDADALAAKIKEAAALTFDGYGYVAAHFSLEQMAEKTLQVYKGLV